MIEDNITQTMRERQEKMVASLKSIVEPEYSGSPHILSYEGEQWVYLEDYNDLKNKIGLLLFSAEQAIENLEFQRMMNYALINECKARGINPFDGVKKDA